jgi:predicted patatin/cPLA2 family phospholipase
MKFSDNEKYALVVQGGGQKGAFAAGVLDTFIAANFDPFSLYIGTSAGALNVASFVTKQRALGLDFILNYTTKHRFFDFNKLLRKQQSLDLDWAFQLVNSGEFPLDLAKGLQNLGQERQALASVTHVEKMTDHYFPIFSENWYDVLRASCAIPILYNTDIEFDGAKWVDGGVSATVPVHESYRRGINNMVVITNQPIQQSAGDANLTNKAERVDLMKSEWIRGIEPYLQRIAPLTQHEKMQQMHSFFVERFNQLRVDYQWPVFNSIPKTWLPDADKLTELLLQQSLKFKNHTPRAMEMLFAHYVSHMGVTEFMNYPPENVNIWELTPVQPLNSKGLMSRKEDIWIDYKQGIMVGKAFLAKVDNACL